MKHSVTAKLKTVFPTHLVGEFIISFHITSQINKYYVRGVFKKTELFK